MNFLAKYAKLLERVFWAGAHAGVGLVTVEVLDVPVQYVPIVAVVLATIKGMIAKKVGNKDSYATLPASLDK